MALQGLRYGGDVFPDPTKGILVHLAIVLGLVKHGAGGLPQGYHVLTDTCKLAVIFLYALGHIFLTHGLLLSGVGCDGGEVSDFLLQFSEGFGHLLFEVFGLLPVVFSRRRFSLSGLSR